MTSSIREVRVDGSKWATEAEFYNALAQGLGSVEWHGRNADAFLETMIYYLELNLVQPPYRVVVSGASDALRPFLSNFVEWLAEARRERRIDPEWGDDVEVSMLIE